MHYENLLTCGSDMIFENNTSFDKIPVEALERKVINIMDLLAQKTLSVTLNDINSRNEVQASS